MTARTEVTRLRDKQRRDRGELDALLDAVHVAHVAIVRDGSPVLFPTAAVRDGDHLLMHGSTGSPWLRMLASGAPAAVAVTSMDALVVARSAFESSIRYRSAVLFGTCEQLHGRDKAQALDRVTEGLIPGRVAELRQPNERELAATLVLALPITEWSLKVSDGWPEDTAEDIATDAWAGVVPLVGSHGTPLPAPDLRAGIDLPASVRALTAG